MTTTRHEPQRSRFLEATAPETVAMLDGFEALFDTPTPVSLPAEAGPAWICLDHVPAASFASWIAECLKFGGRGRRQEAAKAAYDARWAGHGVGARR
jgi:hypothetical protein